MSARDFETHRCEGSLKARCPIRRYPLADDHRRFNRHDGKWHLYEQYTDLDWDYFGITEVAQIAFCPWCGKRL